MIDPTDIRFFRALQQVLAQDPAPELAACRSAVDHAIATALPQDLRAARLSLEALGDAARDRVMAQLHARMASDLSAIWDVLPLAPNGQRPN